MVATPVFSKATLVAEGKETAQPEKFGVKGAYTQAFGLMNYAWAGGSLIDPLGGSLLAE